MSTQVILLENLNMNYLKERENVRDYNSIKENKKLSKENNDIYKSYLSTNDMTVLFLKL